MLIKPDDYNLFLPWLGTGVLISTGQKWFTHRKVITPAFHFKILEQFIEDFDEQTNILVNKLKLHSDTDQAFNITPYIVLCALDVICATSMGITVNAQSEKDSSYVKAVNDLISIFYGRMYSVLQSIDLYFKMTKNYLVQTKSIQILHQFTYNVIEKHRNELDAKKEDKLNVPKSDTDYNDFGIKTKMPLLDVLLNAEINGKALTNKEIREEVDTFMFAGHDTTTSAISFVLYNLAKYPYIQRKVFKEIRHVIGDDMNTKTSHNDLCELKYLDLVIKETLRLYPSVPYIARVFNEDHLINGKIYPKNSTVKIGICLMNRNPKYFEDPEKFIPERFNNITDAEKQNPYAYVPFSAGPRNCIGQKFALLEIKTTISKILRHYELILGNSNEEIILYSAAVLKSRNGVNIKIKKRNYE